MKTAMAIIACSLLSATLVQAQSPAPRFVVVRDTTPEQGTIYLTTLKAYVEKVPVKRQVNVNGRVEERTQFYQRAIHKYDSLDARDSCVITPDGKQLPIEEVWKRLKPSTVLVVSGDLNRPSPEFLRALSADTLVFIPAPMKK